MSPDSPVAPPATSDFDAASLDVLLELCSKQLASLRAVVETITDHVAQWDRRQNPAPFSFGGRRPGEGGMTR